MLPRRKTRRRGCGDTGVHLVGATPIESCRLVRHQSMPAGLLAPALAWTIVVVVVVVKPSAIIPNSGKSGGLAESFFFFSCRLARDSVRWNINDPSLTRGERGGTEGASERAIESTTRLSNYTDNNMIAATALHCFIVGHATPSWCAHGRVQRQITTTSTTNQNSFPVMMCSWANNNNNNFFLIDEHAPAFSFHHRVPLPPHRPCFTAAGISGGGCRFSNLLHWWYSWTTA